MDGNTNPQGPQPAPTQAPTQQPPAAAAPAETPVQMAATAPMPSSTPSPVMEEPGGKKKLLLIIPVVILLLLVVGGGGAYAAIIKPRSDAVKFSNKTVALATPVRTGIGAVGSAVKEIVNIVTGQGQDSSTTPTELLFNIDTSDLQASLPKLTGQGQVAGVATTKEEEAEKNALIAELGKVTKAFKENGDFGVSTKVLGESSIEPEIVSQLRKLKDVSSSAKNEANSAEEDLKSLTEYMAANGGPAGNADLKETVGELSSLNERTETYLSEAKKTSDYYYKTADIRVQLTPFFYSFITVVTDIARAPDPRIYVGRLDELTKTLTEIEGSLKAVKTSELPAGMEPIHNDNLKTISTLKTSLLKLRAAVQSLDATAFVSALVTLQQDLEPLGTRAATQELNFWQNNTILREHESLAGQYQSAEEKLGSFAEKNKLPF